MITKIVEATNGPNNWGKFLLARHDTTEWNHQSHVDPGVHLIPSLGPHPNDIWVLDLQTGEGARFTPRPHAHASGDLDKHRVWVCPLFEPFLAWLYERNLTDLTTLPDHVDLTPAPAMMFGYRRPGPPSDLTTKQRKVLDNRLRRMAKRQGLELIKSRTRDPVASDYGAYWLVDGAGALKAGPTLDLLKIVAVLLEGSPISPAEFLERVRLDAKYLVSKDMSELRTEQV